MLEVETEMGSTLKYDDQSRFHGKSESKQRAERSQERVRQIRGEKHCRQRVMPVERTHEWSLPVCSKHINETRVFGVE